ncbi:Pentatricopeptide (PPR) repeat-containing protein, putative [Theobroma cacao]|uniref:Pentatricopeptide (PPR) repeat-containing protein, putative n=1 Tax=Theobroma cacao TaxID=3641 RepID=A0A061F174_THECC|nr:Pentatricopeptide (PPR) repeat-containing protein, putative [Theobroma cacao]
MKKNLLKPLQNPQSKSPQPLPPLSPLLDSPQTPTPSLSLFPTIPQPHHQNQLFSFLKTYLTHQPLTPKTLLHFLKIKLHHHPVFTHYDFQVFSWASTIDSFHHDHSTYLWMAHSLASSHRFSQLRSLLSFIAANPCPCSPGIFSCPQMEPLFRFVIDSFCRARKLNDAVFAFETMKKLIDGRPSVVIYNVLINGYLKNGDFDKALGFYERMERDRVKPDVYTFNTLINGYCRNGKFESGLELFREMKEKGCSPNVVTFNTLIRGFFRERKVDEAVKMAYEMIQLGCDFSSVTCEILVNGLCKEGRLLEACDLVIDFSRRMLLPKGFDYCDLMEELCGKGNGRAFEVVNELWIKGNVPSLIACTTLIEGLRRLGRREDAFRLMDKMLKDGIVPDIMTFNCLMQDLCDLGRTMDANKFRLVASSKGLEPDEVTYNILIYGYTREGRRKEGEILVDEMLDKGFIPDIARYNRLMDGLSNSKSLTLKKVSACRRSA